MKMTAVPVPASGCFNTNDYVAAKGIVNLAFYAGLVTNSNVGPGAQFFVDGVLVDLFGYDTSTDRENFSKIFHAAVSPGYHCFSFAYTNTNDTVQSGTIISYF